MQGIIQFISALSLRNVVSPTHYESNAITEEFYNMPNGNEVRYEVKMK